MLFEHSGYPAELIKVIYFLFSHLLVLSFGRGDSYEVTGMLVRHQNLVYWEWLSAMLKWQQDGCIKKYLLKHLVIKQAFNLNKKVINDHCSEFQFKQLE